MGIESRHFKEELQELLDGRLDLEARLEVEKHLQSCEECRRELEALRWTKRFSQQQYAAEAVPAKLEENILAALNLEDRRSGRGTVFPWSWWPQPRAILAYGLLLFVAIALVLSYFILRVPSEKSPELASQPKVSITPETSKSESTSKPELASPPALSSKPLMSAKPKLPSKPKLFTKPKLVAKPALPSQVARDYRNYKGEKLRLMLETVTLSTT